jgi:hypothetical protein
MKEHVQHHRPRRELPAKIPTTPHQDIPRRRRGILGPPERRRRPTRGVRKPPQSQQPAGECSPFLLSTPQAWPLPPNLSRLPSAHQRGTQESRKDSAARAQHQDRRHPRVPFMQSPIRHSESKRTMVGRLVRLVPQSPRRDHGPIYASRAPTTIPTIRNAANHKAREQRSVATENWGRDIARASLGS